ncbi:hypothetical protein ACWIUD_02860 [Helicobacter sp. 23-1044]
MRILLDSANRTKIAESRVKIIQNSQNLPYFHSIFSQNFPTK